ncbi:MAG: hypothetical protein Q4E55_03210 [Bacteroidales bacterium]|nr:hypothetical protein [Bacteroidales bacterium]
MKKFFYMAVATVAFLCSCTTDDDPVKNTPLESPTETPIVPPTVFTASIDEPPSINEADSRVVITLDGYVKWEENDEISINGKTYTAAASGVQVPFVGEGATMVDGKYRVYFPAHIYKDPYHAILPAEYKYTKEHYEMPMYAESNTTRLCFKNLCSILTVQVSWRDIDAISSVTLFSDKQMNGEFTVDLEDPNNEFLKFTEEPTWENQHVTIQCDSPEVLNEGESRVFHFTIPTQEDATLWVVVTGPNATKIMKTKEHAVTIRRSKYYSFMFGTKNSQTSCLPGEFSVSPTKKVHFSKSNLYWNGTPTDYKRYHFENNPTNHPTSRYYNYLGNFYWSSNIDLACSPNGYYDISATTDDKLFCDEEHKMTVDEEAGYYALSSEEWEYVTKRKTDASQTANPMCKLGVKVGNQENCMVIAPDGFVGELKAEYTLDEANALSLACLPPTYIHDGAGGGERGRDFYEGFYWTADCDGTQATEAKSCYFNIWEAKTNQYPRRFGLALRLVK